MDYWTFSLLLLILVSSSSSSSSASSTFMSDAASWNIGSDSAWAMVAGRLHQPKCIDIPQNMSLCQGIGYSQMRLPNLLDHDTVGEMTQQSKSWVPLLGIRCHPNTRLFLCSLFSPVCLDTPIWPCRSLCFAVKAGCEMRMKKYGYPWPEMLRCDKFPEDNDLCIAAQIGGGKQEDTSCGPCKEPETLEAIVDNYCRADFVMKIRVKNNVVVDRDMRITALKKRKIFKKVNIKKKDLRKMEFYLQNGATCDCDRMETPGGRFFMIMGRKQGHRLVTDFVMVWNKRNKVLRMAMKAIRKPDICKGDLQVLAQPPKTPNKKNKRKRDRQSRRRQSNNNKNREP